MPIVFADNFSPHTGAYWKGYTDACDGKPRTYPIEWSETAVRDYWDGYDKAISETKKQS